MEKTAKALKSYGYRVTITGWNRDIDSDSSVFIEHDIPCERIGILSNYGQGIDNIYNLLKWQRKLLLRLIKKRDSYDIIHACDFDTAIPAMLCKITYKKKLVYDIFDYYADHIRIENGFIKSIIRAVDRYMINHANAVILADKNRKEQIGKNKQKSITTIYNSPPDRVKEIETNHSRRVDDKYRISYVGILQKDRSIMEVMAIVDKHQSWVFDLAGFGGDQEEIVEMARGSNNVNWHGRVSYRKALEIGYRSDVMFAVYDPKIKNNQFASPNKIFEAMMLSRPIIVAKDTGVENIVLENNCGLCVDYGESWQLERAMNELQENVQLRSRLGENGRRGYETTYSWRNMEQKLKTLYSSL